MKLKLLDPAKTLEALAGVPDILTPAAKARQDMYNRQTCPTCSGQAFKLLGDATTLFSPGDPLPRHKLKCTDCDCIFDPHSGLIVATGNAGKAFTPVIPILATE